VTYIPPSCEPSGSEHWYQAMSAWTSLAFVAFGLLIIWCALRRRRRIPAVSTGSITNIGFAPNALTIQVLLGVLAIGNGIGSVIQHGPEPSWNPIVHDPPLMGALALVAADAVAGLRPEWRFRHWWWLTPTALTTALAAIAPGAASVSMGVAAAIAIPLAAWRAWQEPAIRPHTLLALGILGTGGIIGELSRPGRPLCVPGSAFFESGWSGHAIWHILAAAALWVLAPTLGARPAVAT